MTFQKFDAIKYSMIGAIGGLIAAVLAIIFQMAKIPIWKWSNNFVSISASTINIDLRTQVENAAQFSKIGDILFTFMTDTLSLDVKYIFTIILGSIIIVVGGRILTGFIKGKIKTMVLVSYILGAAAFGVIIPLFTKTPYLTTLVSIMVYGMLLGIIMQLIVSSKQLKYLND